MINRTITDNALHGCDNRALRGSPNRLDGRDRFRRPAKRGGEYVTVVSATRSCIGCRRLPAMKIKETTQSMPLSAMAKYVPVGHARKEASGASIRTGSYVIWRTSERTRLTRPPCGRVTRRPITHVAGVTRHRHTPTAGRIQARWKPIGPETRPSEPGTGIQAISVPITENSMRSRSAAKRAARARRLGEPHGRVQGFEQLLVVLKSRLWTLLNHSLQDLGPLGGEADDLIRQVRRRRLALLGEQV